MKKIEDMIFNINCWIENNHGNIELFLTIIAIIVASDLLYETRRQANIADKALNLAQDNFRNENRPWVGVKDLVPYSLIPNKNNSWSVNFQNYGKTPALKVKTIVGFGFWENISYDGFTYEIKNFSLATVPPNEIIHSEIYTLDSLQLSKRYKSMLDKKLYFFIYGMVDYTDIFDGHDTTYFSYFYNTEKSSFFLSPKYNTMK